MRLETVRELAKSKQSWLMVGIVALAFLLRVVGLDFQSLWRDEVDAVRFATRAWDQVLGMFLEPGQNGPLYYLLLRPWLYLVGESGYALRFFSAFFGTLAIPLVYRLARRLFPSLRLLALLAALLAAISPYLVWYAQEGKMYSLVLALVLFSMDRYLAALQRGGWHRWLLYLASTGAAVYVHLLAALIIPVQIVAFFLIGGESRRVRWQAWLLSMLLLFLPYLPLARWQLPLVLSPAETGYRFVPLHDMLLSLLANYSLGPILGSQQWAVVFFLILLVDTAWVWWRVRRPRLAPLGILACWFLVPALSLFLLTLVRPMYTARYLIFVLPAYLILVTAGVTVIARRSRREAAVLLAALLVISSLGLWRQSRTHIKADFRSATEYVASRRAPRDLLLFQIPYGRHSFDYYLSRSGEPLMPDAPDDPASTHSSSEHRIYMPLLAPHGEASYRWAEGLYTNGGMDPHSVDSSMAKLTAGAGTVWLIATEVDLWDERGLVQAWLEQHASLSDQMHSVGVSVYRFDLP